MDTKLDIVERLLIAQLITFREALLLMEKEYVHDNIPSNIPYVPYTTIQPYPYGTGNPIWISGINGINITTVTDNPNNLFTFTITSTNGEKNK